MHDIFLCSHYCVEFFVISTEYFQIIVMEQELIKNCIEESAKVILSLIKIDKDIKKASDLITESLMNGGKILIFGNGGSAADSQHFAAELVGKFRNPLRSGIPAIALTVDTSAITAISNDWDFGYVFERQIEALGRSGDVAFGITTSGKSQNVLRALQKGKELKMKTIALVGKNTEHIKPFSDVVISVPSDDTQRIQEAHTLIIHIICEIIEQRFNKRFTA